MLLLLATAAAAAAQGAAAPPHVVYVMGDDVGWHDVSWHNPSVRTPVLSQLLAEGIELDRVYTYKYCSPTRASLMTGRLPIHNTQINAVAAMHGKQYLVGVDVRMSMLPEKLAVAGYVSYHIGKWHLGAYSRHMIPVARGFNHSLGYLSGGEDHYTQQVGFGAFTPTFPPPQGRGVDLWRDGAPAYGENGTYGAFIYTAEAVKRIQQHDADAPMFMYLAFQNNHCPLQVPERFQNKSVDNILRRVYHGMSACLDESVGNVTAALRARGMWGRTYLIFTSDNGGPIHDPASGCQNSDPAQPGMTGANNYPLRGGKVTDFEGGVRVVGFVSGGALPAALRGQKRDGMIHVADLHATICSMAGISAADEAPSAVGLPPVDGVDMLPYLTGQVADSPRTELMLGWWGNETVMPADAAGHNCPVECITGGAIIVGEHKLLYGQQLGMAYWTGPEHPNGTADDYPVIACYPDACLFNIRQDPTEHVNLAGTQPELLATLWAKLRGYLPGFFQTTDMGPVGECREETVVLAEQKGFLGPPCPVA